MYWMLAFEGEVHSIWVLWTNGLQEYKGEFFFKSGKACNILRSGSKITLIFCWGLAEGLLVAGPGLTQHRPLPPESF